MGSWKVTIHVFILTSCDPGSRTLTALASFSVTGCTNKAFPGEKHKHAVILKAASHRSRSCGLCGCQPPIAILGSYLGTPYA